MNYLADEPTSSLSKAAVKYIRNLDDKHPRLSRILKKAKVCNVLADTLLALADDIPLNSLETDDLYSKLAVSLLGKSIAPEYTHDTAFHTRWDAIKLIEYYHFTEAFVGWMVSRGA